MPMFAQLINAASLSLGQITASYLIPFMLIVFFVCVGIKMLIYYVSRTQLKVIREFEIRVHRHLDDEYEETQGLKFHRLTKSLLNRTWNDYFLMRKKNMRRRFDKTTSFLDRIFYIDTASRTLFEDTIKQTNYIEKELNPNFRSVTSFAFSSNIYFNHLFGLIPFRLVNQFLSLLPGLFIIAGIFGTFLGIVKGIPELKGLDPTNVESARTVLNHFLDQMAFSMNTSIMGIFFSVFFTILNSLFSPKAMQADAFEIYSHSLEFLYKNGLTEGEDSDSGNNGQSSNEGSHSNHSPEKQSSAAQFSSIPEISTEEVRINLRKNEIIKKHNKDKINEEHVPKVIVLNGNSKPPEFPPIKEDIKQANNLETGPQSLTKSEFDVRNSFLSSIFLD